MPHVRSTRVPPANSVKFQAAESLRATRKKSGCPRREPMAERRSLAKEVQGGRGSESLSPRLLSRVQSLESSLRLQPVRRSGERMVPLRVVPIRHGTFSSNRRSRNKRDRHWLLLRRPVPGLRGGAHRSFFVADRGVTTLPPSLPPIHKHGGEVVEQPSERFFSHAQRNQQLCKKARRTNAVSMLADGDELPRKNKVPSHRRYR